MMSMILGATIAPHSAHAKSNAQKTAKKETVVHATKRGKKYHLKSCPFVRERETTSMSEKEARDKGLAPCGRCIKKDK